MQNVKDLDIAEIAKMVRRDLKEGIKIDPRLAGIEKFSVTISRYSQGQSLTVEVVKASVNPFNVRYFALSEAIENASWSDFTGGHVSTHIGDAVRAEIKTLPSEEKYNHHMANVSHAVEHVISKYQEMNGEPGDRWFSFYDYFRFASSFQDDAVEAAKEMAVSICQEALAALKARSLAPSIQVIEAEQYEADMAELAEAQQLDDEEQNASVDSDAVKLKSTVNLNSANNIIEFPAIKTLSGEEVEQNLDNAIMQAKDEIEEAELTLSNLKKAIHLKGLRLKASQIAKSIEDYQKILSLQ